MDIILTAHNYLRLLILTLGALGILRALVSLGTRNATFMRVDEVLSQGYTGALDLQVVVGVILALMLVGQSEAVQWIHPIIMLPAVFVAHLGRRYQDRADRERQKAQLAIYAASLGLVAAGLAVIGELRLV
jgi:hypothetical protein